VCKKKERNTWGQIVRFADAKSSVFVLFFFSFLLASVPIRSLFPSVFPDCYHANRQKDRPHAETMPLPLWPEKAAVHFAFLIDCGLGGVCMGFVCLLRRTEDV
jgi:hypothetical protein